MKENFHSFKTNLQTIINIGNFYTLHTIYDVAIELSIKLNITFPQEERLGIIGFFSLQGSKNINK